MNIALLADDTKKVLMQNFCIAYRSILSKHTLFATGTTGRLVEDATNLSIRKEQPGHMGGNQQLAARIESNEIDAVILFRDPAQHSFHDDPQIMSITDFCDEYNIPLATNLASAEILIKAIDRGDLDWREMYH